MEWRIRIPTVRPSWIVVCLVAGLGAFMALDRTTLHWYVPDRTALRSDVASVEQQVDAFDSQLSSLRRDFSGVEGQVEGLDISKLRTLQGTFEVAARLRTDQLERVFAAVAVLSLVQQRGGAQTAVSPAGQACMNWLRTGLGSFTDCGFRHAESP